MGILIGNGYTKTNRKQKKKKKKSDCIKDKQ